MNLKVVWDQKIDWLIKFIRPRNTSWLMVEYIDWEIKS